MDESQYSALIEEKGFLKKCENFLTTLINNAKGTQGVNIDSEINAENQSVKDKIIIAYNYCVNNKSMNANTFRTQLLNDSNTEINEVNDIFETLSRIYSQQSIDDGLKKAEDPKFSTKVLENLKAIVRGIKNQFRKNNPKTLQTTQRSNLKLIIQKHQNSILSKSFLGRLEEEKNLNSKPHNYIKNCIVTSIITFIKCSH